MSSPWEIALPISVHLGSGSKSTASPSTFDFSVLTEYVLIKVKICTEKDQVLQTVHTIPV